MFSEAVKRVQEARGSRAPYARVEAKGGFDTEIAGDIADFIATIHTAFLATASDDGQPYVQHRGGPRGFIKVIDAHTLAFLDFAGNRQYVTTGNLSENDRYCLLLMDFEHRRRVKLWGTAHVEPVTPEWLERLADPTYRARPEQVIVLRVEAWDANCPQHITPK